ncbi:hypothetical protein D3C73_986200 [compost metagenome]
MADVATIEHHVISPVRADRRRAETRLAQVQPESRHALDLRRLHRSFTRRRRIKLVVMNPEHAGLVLREQALIAERLGKNRQAVAAALGEGAVGVDDQQVERRRGLKRSHQQPVAAVFLAAGRLRARGPGAERLDGQWSPGFSGLHRLAGLFGQVDPGTAHGVRRHHRINIAPRIVEPRHHASCLQIKTDNISRNVTGLCKDVRLP